MPEICPNCCESELEPWQGHEGWLSCPGCSRRYTPDQLAPTPRSYLCPKCDQRTLSGDGLRLNCPCGYRTRPPRVPLPPEVARQAASRYSIDSEALEMHPEQIEIVTDLVAATQTPGWTQERACRPCYDWDAGRRVSRPRPPRADDATHSCSGCTWSFLDGTQLLRNEERLLRLRLLETTWARRLDWLREQTEAVNYERKGGDTRPRADGSGYELTRQRYVREVDPVTSGIRRLQAARRQLKAVRRLIQAIEKEMCGRRQAVKTATARFERNRPE